MTFDNVKLIEYIRMLKESEHIPQHINDKLKQARFLALERHVSEFPVERPDSYDMCECHSEL